jgi:hypothetical protein
LIIRVSDETVLNQDRLNAFLREARLAGGTLQFPVRNQMFNDLLAAKNQIRSGFNLHCRADLLEPAEGQDVLDTLLGAVESGEHSWLMPACVGYAAATPVAQRSGARDGHPHCFVEPLIGLVQLASVYQDELPPTWWGYASDLSDSVFSLSFSH